MTNHVKNQHFVPRFLLNYFADSNHNLWCYDKKWKRSVKKGVGGVAFEQYFYDRIPGEKEGSLEYVYQRAESYVAPIIQKIVSGNTLRSITLEEKVALAMFIVLQLNRTKTALKEIEDFQKQYWGPIMKFASATGAKIDSELGPAKDLWISRMEDALEFTEIIIRKAWYLASSSGKFYTSDHPVVKGNYKNRAISGIRGVLGIDSDGIEIYFPLTPSLLLCIRCERSYSVPKEEVVPYLSENIEYVNHLQVRQSDNFIFAADDNFRVVEDMLTDDERRLDI